MNLEELLNRLCDNELSQKINVKISRQIRGPSPLTTKPLTTPQLTNLPSAARAHITSKAEINRQVWRQGQSQCSNCKSTYALEIDHIIPRAAGGLSTFQNMRLLCRSCNQRAAIEFFGLTKMEKHLQSNAF
jgi:hypothetical protein